MLTASYQFSTETDISSEYDFLSKMDVPVSERLIFALDVPSKEEAIEIVDELGGTVNFYKLGLELFMADGYHALISDLVDRGKKVFVDLKFFDIPRTVASAIRQLEGRHATFATVHGNDTMLKAACDARDELKILAVTALTSLDKTDMKDFGLDNTDVSQLVTARARKALSLGCDGVISSGLEAKELRNRHGDKFLIVVPGVRPVINDEDQDEDSLITTADDQKRTVSVEEAFLSGADYIVMGKPIRDAKNRLQAAEIIQNQISRVFSHSP